MNHNDSIADEIKQLVAEVDNVEFYSNDDVRAFISNITKLIYDYKMLGKIYDFYIEDIEYHKQNKVIFTNIEDVVRNVAEFCAAFPNLKTNIENIIVYKEQEDFYKVSKRLHYWGNNYGYSRFGPPTGKSLANNCLSMSLLHLKRIEGKWKITLEINNDSELWLQEVQTTQQPASL
jgi:hypothetical protein